MKTPLTKAQQLKRRKGRKFIHQYAPRGGCKEVMECRDDEVLISGPAGTGKSRACLEKIYLACMLTPNTKALLLRKTLRSLGSSALATWRNYVIKEAVATGQVVYYGGSAEEPPQYRFKNGSRVVIGGLDNPARVMSTEYDLIYIQEATEVTIEDLEFCKTRLRNWNISFQQLIMDCNPAGEKHWLKLRCNDKITTLIESRHEDNPRLFKEDGTVTKEGKAYIAILDSLTGVRKKRLRLGLWVSAEGIVFEEFDPAVHVLDWEYDEEGNRLPLPLEWERYWVIDFGLVHPFVLKCYAEDEEGTLYMYREIYMTQRTVQEHVKTILDIVCPEKTETWWDHINRVDHKRTVREWIEPRPVAVICDHDAEDRRTFELGTGLGTIPAIKTVHSGINAHKERLKHERFFLMRDALVEKDRDRAAKLLPTSTEEEYGSYIWKVDASGHMNGEPVKINDDGMDTDRYMTAHKDLRGKSRAQELSAFFDQYEE